MSEMATWRKRGLHTVELKVLPAAHLVLAGKMWDLTELLFSLLDSFLYICLHLNKLFLKKTHRHLLEKTHIPTDSEGPTMHLWMSHVGFHYIFGQKASLF